jgi:hypothetical protein
VIIQEVAHYHRKIGCCLNELQQMV